MNLKNALLAAALVFATLSTQVLSAQAASDQETLAREIEKLVKAFNNSLPAMNANRPCA